MDFSNLTKEQVEWIKGLVEQAWYDAYNTGLRDDEEDWYQSLANITNDWEDSRVASELSVLPDYREDWERELSRY